MHLGDLLGTLVFPNLVLSEVALIHFHILFIVPKRVDDTFVDCLTLEKKLFDEVLFEWRRNYGSRKYPDYRPLCTYFRKFVRGRVRSNFDLHYVNPVFSSGGSADVCFYVMKYMLKPSDRQQRLQQALRLNLDEDEYEDLWSLVRPRHFESEGLGLGSSDYFMNGQHRIYSVDSRILSHLRKGIEASKSFDNPFPQISSVDDGKYHPLARYYKNRPEVFTMDDFYDFYYASKDGRPDNVILSDIEHVSQVVKRIDDFDMKKQNVDFQQTALDLDDLYDVCLTDDFIDL